MFDPPFPPPKPAIIRAADAALLRPRLLVPAGCSRAVLPGILAVPMMAAGAGAAAAISHVAYQGATADQTTYTFSGLSFGAAAADRWIAIFASGRTNTSTPSTINAVTIAGVSASEIITDFAVGDSPFGSRGGIYLAQVPTGTSGNVVVTFSHQMSRAAVAVYRLVGIAGATAADTANGSVTGTGNSGDKTLQIDIPAGGVMLAGAAGFGTQNSFSAAGMTTDFTNTTIESSYRMSAGHGNYGSAQTNLTVTCNLASNFRELLFLAASWAPAS
jgi:hypothetical protein